MAAVRGAGDRATKWIRWLAHGIGSLAAAWWLFIGIVEVVWPHTPEAPLEGALLAGLMGVAILGALVHGYHFPWPGLGQVQREGDAFRWEPIE